MKLLTSVIALTACLVTTTGFAADTASDEQLKRAYIEGFLAGAQLTDNEIIRRLSSTNNKSSEDSGFLDRAFKTRVGNVRGERPGTFYAGFCLPDDKASDVVIENIIKDMAGSDTLSGPEKAGAVYKTLQNRYPC